MRGLLGLRGQSMGGNKRFYDAQQALIQVVDVSTGSGSITASKPCTALIYAWGGGGSGSVFDTSGGSTPGGGGGGALFKRVKIAQGQTIAYSAGAGGAARTGGLLADGLPGGASTVTLPNGVALTAGGGGGGLAHSTPGAGGVAAGGDINRTGGAGSLSGTGATGDFGAAGGIANSGCGGGGGAAGFYDLGWPSGAGSDGAGDGITVTLSGVAPGGGSGASGGGGGGAGSGAGGAGRVVILLVRAY